MLERYSVQRMFSASCYSKLETAHAFKTYENVGIHRKVNYEKVEP
jgi:hypothetical protein